MSFYVVQAEYCTYTSTGNLIHAARGLFEIYFPNSQIRLR